MARIFLKGMTVLALGILCSLPSFAQNLGATRGDIAGTVYDPSKAVVSGASVTITGPIGSQQATTNGQGAFTFTGLVPGTYAVKVEKEGFKSVLLSKVEVLINNTAGVNVTLETGAASTVVEVTTSALAVDTSSSSINSNLDNSFYNSVPVARNVSAVMKLAPGVVSGLGTAGPTKSTGGAATDANPSISGASGLENLYVADGVVLNDPSFGGFGAFSTIYGALGVGITPAFVKEVEVKTAAFEPQYGHSTGGVIQMVTKSGSQHIHGSVGAYFETAGMQSVFANKDDFNPVNKTGREIANASYEGDLELGGYIPGLRNHLFFFGAFDPTYFVNNVDPASNSALYGIDPHVNRRTYTYSYAGKLTLRANSSTTIESSVFGDPAHTNTVPWFTLAAANTSGNSKWDFGTRNWDTRIETALTPTWTADFAYTRAWNHFTETPADISSYPIEDQTQTAGLTGQLGDYQAQGLANGVVNYQSHTQSFNVDTSKIFHFAGAHTASFGYFWQAPVYDDVTKYSFTNYAVPATNATGGDPGTDEAVGAQSDASLQLQFPANWDPGSQTWTGDICTLCPTMTVPGYANPQPVVLYQVRGRFDGGISHNTGKYHAAYANDSWQMGTHVTLNLGLRWEQQRLTGTAAHAFFNDQWSPRIGFIVDPFGDRKTKIYTNYGRLAFVLPLDMAVRELSSEDDNLNEYWAPDSTGGSVTFNQFGAPNFVPDAAHLLNNAVGGIATPVSISLQSGGEPFTPGIRMEYNDEFVVGAEHEFHGGIFVSARYVDRRMKRVVEDEVGQSVEQLTALAFNGGSYSYVIGNPSAQQAVFVTPNEITWTPTDANNPNASAPAGCFDSAGNITPYTSGSMFNTFGALQGAACFPAVNGQPNTVLDPTSGEQVANPAALYGGEYFGNGCSFCHPGIYPSPQRNYQAVEFEVNKSFSNNWLLRSNLRVGRLVGNYEGAYRNDNNQSDPGISSLFDLTSGELGLLGSQLGIGPLNTDRKYVFNALPSYTIPTGFAKNMVLGAAVTIQSGIPLTTLAAQQIYGNPGEVPLFGRGDLGRSPVTGTVSAHLEYPIKFGESKALRFEFDAFNIANTKRFLTSTQQVDLGFQQLNADFTNHVPLTFVAPFSSRASVMFTF